MPPRRSTARKPSPIDRDAQRLALSILSSECAVCGGGRRPSDRLARPDERRRWIHEQPVRWSPVLQRAGRQLVGTRALLRAYVEGGPSSLDAQRFRRLLGSGLLRPQLGAGPGLVLEPVAEARGDASWVAAWGLAAILSDHPGRVRRCGLPPCHCYFVDTSRGGRRRWCSMALCGNRAKARRHYRRVRP